MYINEHLRPQYFAFKVVKMIFFSLTACSDWLLSVHGDQIEEKGLANDQTISKTALFICLYLFCIHKTALLTSQPVLQ